MKTLTRWTEKAVAGWVARRAQSRYATAADGSGALDDEYD
jgi:hypothetical protein